MMYAIWGQIIPSAAKEKFNIKGQTLTTFSLFDPQKYSSLRLKLTLYKNLLSVNSSGRPFKWNTNTSINCFILSFFFLSQISFVMDTYHRIPVIILKDWRVCHISFRNYSFMEQFEEVFQNNATNKYIRKYQRRIQYHLERV